MRFRAVGWLGTMLVGAILGVVLVTRARRLERPALQISGDGVVFHDAVSRFALSWNEIDDITGVLAQTKSQRPIVFARGDGATEVIGNAALYAPGGEALYWMIRHYWLHPHERGELTNGVAVERLAAGRFPAK